MRCSCLLPPHKDAGAEPACEPGWEASRRSDGHAARHDEHGNVAASVQSTETRAPLSICMLSFAELPMGAKKLEAASKKRVALDATGDDSMPRVRKYFEGFESAKDQEVQAAILLHATIQQHPQAGPWFS